MPIGLGGNDQQVVGGLKCTLQGYWGQRVPLHEQHLGVGLIVEELAQDRGFQQRFKRGRHDPLCVDSP
jgi:hypothetical protein